MSDLLPLAAAAHHFDAILTEASTLLKRGDDTLVPLTVKLDALRAAGKLSVATACLLDAGLQDDEARLAQAAVSSMARLLLLLLRHPPIYEYPHHRVTLNGHLAPALDALRREYVRAVVAESTATGTDAVDLANYVEALKNAGRGLHYALHAGRLEDLLTLIRTDYEPSAGNLPDGPLPDDQGNGWLGGQDR